MKEKSCRICGHCAEGKKLSNHIRASHGLSSEQYTIMCLYNGQRPLCLICGIQTRYVAFSFKTYCKEHSCIAESIGGSQGGKAAAWNKGKTAKTDARVKRHKGKENPFWGHTHSDETRQKISTTKLLSRLELALRMKKREDEFEILTPFDAYASRQAQYLDFKCKKCQAINKKTLQAFERGSLCDVCHPVGQSQSEIEIFEWLVEQGINAQQGDRNIIAPKELDIVIPDKKIAIEFDGLHWHSELSPNGIDPNAHLEKMKLCQKAGWSLIHVFSDDWRDRKEIVKSMILHRLGRSLHHHHARKCIIKELLPSERKTFFDASHISGDARSRIAWGLYSSGILIAALSLRIPRQKKWQDRLEIARYATRPGFHVAGGLSKLMSNAKKYAAEQEKGLISYADRRFGLGEGYTSVGFQIVGDTGIDYWYTDGTVRFDRFICRASNGQTEHDIAKMRKVGRIYGCGSNVYLFDSAAYLYMSQKEQ